MRRGTAYVSYVCAPVDASSHADILREQVLVDRLP